MAKHNNSGKRTGRQAGNEARDGRKDRQIENKKIEKIVRK
jgi:hypothetical protein